MHVFIPSKVFHLENCLQSIHKYIYRYQYIQIYIDDIYICRYLHIYIHTHISIQTYTHIYQDTYINPHIYKIVSAPLPESSLVSIVLLPLRLLSIEKDLLPCRIFFSFFVLKLSLLSCRTMVSTSNI
jgi:hypothetical protein